jgi:hypothetical protein
VVDDVDAGASGRDDPGTGRTMRADQRVAGVGRVGGRADLLLGVVVVVGNRLAAVTVADRDLDDLAAAADLFADRLAELLDAVGAADQPMALDAHEPGAIVPVGRVARGDQLAGTRRDPRPLRQPEQDRFLQADVEQITVRGADDARDADVQRELRVLRSDHPEIGGRHVEAEVGRGIAGIGPEARMEMTLEHARHQASSRSGRRPGPRASP